MVRGPWAVDMRLLHRGVALGLLLTAGLMIVSNATRAEDAMTSADAALREARDAARTSRHEQAIAAYRRAGLAAPERRREWLLEEAEQHTWAGQLDNAIALFREAVGSLGGADSRRARLGLARALSWAERHGEALVQYRQVLRDHPDDIDAKRGIGRVLSWRGEHRAAVEHTMAWLQEHPHDREGTVVLAESLDWMGRPDRAQAILRQQLEGDPRDEQAAALLQKLERAQRPEFAIDFREFDQSDDLGVREWSASWRSSLNQGRGSIRPRLSQTRFTPPEGPVGRILVLKPGLDARYRINDALEWHGSLGLDLIDTRGADGDHRRWTHDTYLSWWPSDHWRLDASSARWTFDSEETLRRGLTAQQFKLSADLMPDELTRLTSRTDYADGNLRRGLQLEAERRWSQRPRVLAGLRHHSSDFTLPGQRGYYNPDFVKSTEVTAQASGWLPAGLSWELRGALGRESERGQPTRPVRSASLALSWAPQPNLNLEAAFDYSTSRTLEFGGFRRSVTRVSLKYRP
jgi:tetratricopeptide (TPR) repeat protein